MKKKRKIVTILAVFVLGALQAFTHNDLHADVLSELSDWMNKVSRMSDRIDALEADINSFKDVIESLERKEKQMSQLVSRVEALEQTETGQTMDTLKQGVADLRKALEDQQVITAVLEKKYKQAQMPLKPLEQSIEEQKNIISTLVARIDAQDKKMKLVGDRDKKNIETITTLTKEMEDKLASISRMAEMIKEMEKRGGGGVGAAIAANLPGSADAAGTTMNETAADTSSILPKKKLTIADVLKAQGFREVGSEFFVKDVRFRSFGSSVEVSGTMMNDSEMNYSVASFKIFVYDADGSFIREQDFSIKGLNKGNVKSFSEIVAGVRMNEVKKYAIAYGNTTQRYQVTDLVTVVDKKGVDTKPSGKDNAGEKTSTDIEEGFEGVGDGFYVRNLKLKQFGSSCEITGELKTLSETYYSVAPFKIKIFDGRKRLIWEQDFSVKGVHGGKIKKFSEFLTGVAPEDVASFEVKHKK